MEVFSAFEISREWFFLTLAGLGTDHQINLAKYLAYFLLHLPGVFGFGLLHYGDGVTGRRTIALALVAKRGAL